MKKILIETSARHIHLTKESLEYLMGEGFELTPRKELSQPGQYVSTTRLNIVGPKKTISNVSILGPIRNYDQVEVSLTDTRTLGVSAPVRESGDINNSASVKLSNPETGKELELKEGLIVAKRHIHMTPQDAKDFNVENGEIVSVKVENTCRSLIFDDVIIRVSDKFRLAMHIDTDESNAANAVGEIYGTLIKHK